MTETALAPIRISPAVVVFDYGEVISFEQSDADRAALIARSGAEPDRFWASYWANRAGLDEGTMSITDYWLQIGRELGAEWGDAEVEELWAIDHKSWLSVNPATLDVIRALRAGGTRLALLSNAGADYGGWLRHGAFARYFEQVFVSGELGLVKPDVAIYAHVIRALGITPAELFFVDNKVENVEGARAAGGEGHHFTDVEGLERSLRSVAAERG